MGSNIVCVSDNPSRWEESVVSDVVESVDFATSKTRVEAPDSASLEINVYNASVAREVYEEFVSYRDIQSGSEGEYRKIDDLIDRFVSAVNESDLDVEL